MRRITVVLEDEEYERLREAAFDRRLSMAEFVRRAVGSAAGRKGESPVVVRVPAEVLGGPVAIGEITKAVEGLHERDRSNRPLKPHAADPKDKAAQEHRKRESTKKSGLCPHRVPVGTFCKRCEEGT